VKRLSAASTDESGAERPTDSLRILRVRFGKGLHGSIRHDAAMPLAADLALLTAFCVVLFGISLRNIKRRWIG
jgi:hypothetical protein